MDELEAEVKSLAYKNKRLIGYLRVLKNYYLGEEFRSPLNQLDEAATIVESIKHLYPKEKFGE